MADSWYDYLHIVGEALVDWAVEADGSSFMPGNELQEDVPPLPKAPQRQSHDLNTIREKHDVNTLKDCLRYFSFPTLLQELEDSLENVRRHKKSKAEHEGFFKGIDKEMQKLSFSYHPDRVSNRGGSSEELVKAQKLQTALNSTRTVLNILNKEFLEDLDIDHKYEFYAKMEITSLGNEDEIKRRISEVLYKTVLLSEIKQENIIAQIRMFLSESRFSLKNYVEGNVPEFAKHRDYALYHLKKCIDGYDKLLTEFVTVNEECKSEKYVHMVSVLREMARKTSRESQTLKKLEKVAKHSLEGQFQVFSTADPMDDYLILPFVYYVNVLLICSLVQEEKYRNIYSLPSPWASGCHYERLVEKQDEDILLNHATDLAFLFYYKECQIRVRNVSDVKKTNKKVLIRVINNFMIDIKNRLENRFRIEDYMEGGSKKYLLEHYAHFMNIAADIDKTVLNMFRDMEKCQRPDLEIKEKYENFMKGTYAFEREIAESLEESNRLQEQVSEAFERNRQVEKEKNDNFMKVTEEYDTQIRDGVDNGKVLQEQVSKILQKSDKNVNKSDMNFAKYSKDLEREISSSLEQSKILQNHVSRLLQRNVQVNKEMDKNTLKVINDFRKEPAECLGQKDRFFDVSNTFKPTDQVMKDNEKIIKGTDEFGEEIAVYTLQQNDLQREHVSEKYETRDQEMEKGKNFIKATDEFGNEIAERTKYCEELQKDVTEGFQKTGEGMIEDEIEFTKLSLETAMDISELAGENILHQAHVSDVSKKCKEIKEVDNFMEFIDEIGQEIRECEEQDEQHQEPVSKEFHIMDQEIEGLDETLKINQVSEKDMLKFSEEDIQAQNLFSGTFLNNDGEIKIDDKNFVKVTDTLGQETSDYVEHGENNQGYFSKEFKIANEEIKVKDKYLMKLSNESGKETLELRDEQATNICQAKNQEDKNSAKRICILEDDIEDIIEQSKL